MDVRVLEHYTVNICCLLNIVRERSAFIMMVMMRDVSGALNSS